jgi:hypothetical protein
LGKLQYGLRLNGGVRAQIFNLLATSTVVVA